MKELRTIECSLKHLPKEAYRKFFFIGITIILLGVAFTTTLKDSAGTLGIVLIGVGGLLFTRGMNLKQEADKRE